MSKLGDEIEKLTVDESQFEESTSNQWGPKYFANSDTTIYNRLLKNTRAKEGTSLQEFLVTVREELGYTQEEMAKQLGIKQNAWSRYETGKRQIPVWLFLEVAEMVGLEFVKRRRKEKDEKKD